MRQRTLLGYLCLIHCLPLSCFHLYCPPSYMLTLQFFDLQLYPLPYLIILHTSVFTKAPPNHSELEFLRDPITFPFFVSEMASERACLHCFYLLPVSNHSSLDTEHITNQRCRSVSVVTWTYNTLM